MARSPDTTLLGALLAAALACAPVAAADEAAGIAWIHEPDVAFAAARDTGRAVIVDVYADWCAPCHVMEAETWRDPEIVRRADGFVMLKVDADAHEAFSDRYGVTILPTTLVLTAEGKLALAVRGVAGADDVAGLMDRVAEGWGPYVEAVARPGDPDALEDAATFLARIGNREEAARSLRLAASLLRSKSAPPARVQAVEIKLAQAALAEGDWKRATAEFDRLSRDGVAPEIRAMALVGLIDVHRSRGRAADAERVLETLRRDYPEAAGRLGR